MDFATLMTAMTGAVARGDGGAAASCFTEDGVYHDVFYGAFTGRSEIARMVDEVFHRDGGDFRWDLHDPVEQGGLGYVRYVFSYRSRLPAYAGRPALFEGVSICRLRDGLIADYREVANALPGLHAMGFPPQRMAKLLARQAGDLAARPEAAGHRRDG
ncbi:MAG: nuclear transport factor 2 family protein [Hyphomicrobiales bacterium]|nr:nuclear transport factor 2 family protein [Hyphomicrobiales bacterium]